ncbi:hypothetical protein ACFL2B_01030 [Patescibacteria group bacterium]
MHNTIIILMLFLSVLFGVGCDSHSSDEKMIQNFNDHKSEFEELLTMFQADKKLGRVGDGFTRSADLESEDIGVTEERLDEYYKLFEELGLPDGIEGYGDKETIYFYSSTAGLGISGSMKGYIYTEDPEYYFEQVNNLDEYTSSDGQSFDAIRDIGYGWYLYYSYED